MITKKPIDRHQELNFLIDDAINHYGKRSFGKLELDFSDIPEFDQNDIVRTMFEIDGRDIYETINESQHVDNVLSAIVNTYTKKSVLNKIDLADAIHACINKHYEKHINELISERIAFREEWSRIASGDRVTPEDYAHYDRRSV